MKGFRVVETALAQQIDVEQVFPYTSSETTSQATMAGFMVV